METEKKKKITISDKIIKRIADYNEELKGLLPSGVSLIGLACTFDKFKEEEAVETYFSDERTNIVLNNCLKLSQNMQFIETNEEIHIFKEIDINGDHISDVKMIAIFKKSNPNEKYKIEQFEKFIRYPEDYFSSPIVENYLNSKEDREKRLILEAKEAIIDAHRHGMRNLSIWGHLKNIKQNIDNPKIINRVFDKDGLMEICILRGIVTDLFYKPKDAPISENAWYYDETNTYTKLIKVLSKGILSKSIEFEQSVINNPLNKILKTEFEFAFNLLSNIFYNAHKHSKHINDEEKRLNIEFEISENQIKIILSNPITNPVNIDFIKKFNDDTLTEFVGEGLRIIKKSANILKVNCYLTYEDNLVKFIIIKYKPK